MTLGNLNKDVLSLVVREVHDTSRNSVFSLLRTSRLLNEVSLPFVFRKIVLDFDDTHVAETNVRIARWGLCSDDLVLRSIRSITVISSSSASGDVERNYLPLAKLLASLDGLKDFTFASLHPIPLAILDALHEHQHTVRLHIKNWTRKSPSIPFGDPVELKLAASPILRSIHAAPYNGYACIDLQYPAFVRIVNSAPNLESMQYEPRGRISSGCVIDLPSREQMDERARQAPLFSVSTLEPKILKSVHFPYHLPSHLFPSPPTPTVVSSDTNYQELLTMLTGRSEDDPRLFIDWSRLHTLTGVIIGSSVSSDVLDGSIFASLKCLSLQFDSRITESDIYNTFFASLNPLESLSIIAGLKHLSVQMLLAHHGPSLRRLHLHQAEPSQMSDHRTILTVAEIVMIQESCPLLDDLGIDVDRTESRERERTIYRLIGGIPLLTQVTLHLDTGLPFRVGLPRLKAPAILLDVYPDFKREDVLNIWEAVGGKRSKRWQTLTVFVGEPTRATAASQFPGHQRFTVERNERDDKQDEVVLTEGSE